MKSAVLRYLKEHQPDYVSGEDICRSLGISRTAVWKYVSALRDEGYSIEARSRLGYRLVYTPDLLLPDEVQNGLGTAFIGRFYYHRLALDSTNDEVQVLARSGAPEGTVVLAEEQNGGRGRLGRAWHSPKGGLWFSVILRPAIPPVRAPEVTFLAAVACVKALERYPGLEVKIKWPNDLVWKSRKLGGILTEMSGEFDRVNHIVLGIGLNVNLDTGGLPSEVQAGSTSVSMIVGFTVSRRRLLQEILAELEQWYGVWQTDGFSPVIHSWKQMQCGLNRPVRVVNLDGECAGTAVDVDESGALLVRTGTGTLERIVAGDVLFKDGEHL